MESTLATIDVPCVYDEVIDEIYCIDDAKVMEIFSEISGSMGGVMGVAIVGNGLPAGHASHTSSLGSKLCKTLDE